MAKARILAIRSYLPEKVLSNKDLEKIVDTTDEWISSRTGMKERRIAAPDEANSDLATKAAQRVLDQAGLTPEQIDLILVTTTTPDYIMPGTAPIVQSKLKANHAAAFDLQAACTGFLYGLSVAKAYVESGMYRRILLIGSEKMSSFIDYEDRSTCVLFGDGACAAIVGGEGEGLAIENVCLGADGDLAKLIIIPGGGSQNPASLETVQSREHYFKMSGREVFKHAVRRMKSSVEECLDRANLSESDISWVIPHQANLRILDALAKNMKISPDRFCKTVHKYGNTSAPSCAITLDELLQEQDIREGEHLLMVAFGAGLTWGATVLTKVKE